ncbi:hypothetical protein [Microbacterium elymi]|uniref:Peptidylprolyl isomerase n=1 Tax=Microbacterium elymi TaxID=2909587 RepID=A0ABY5NK23_9MICO|nr:hypothetical protein [Microbacterium elymi]UUT35426.1 hypothetical protein L2X98_18690 [Microbacterium elymi]
MRKLPAAFAVLSLTAVALVGCASSSGAASCPRTTDAGSSTMGLISVSGSESTAPTVDVRTPLHTKTTQFADVTAGNGSVPISTDSQVVALDVSLVSATTGKKLVSTAYSADQTSAFALSRWTQSFPAFGPALHCATAGTRVAIAIPPDGVEPSSAQSLGLTKDESVVAVIDVRQVFLSAADGSHVYNSGWGKPAVVRAPGGRPGVIVPDSPAPQSLSVSVLKRGDGEKVTGEQPVPPALHDRQLDGQVRRGQHLGRRAAVRHPVDQVEGVPEGRRGPDRRLPGDGDHPQGRR